MSRYELLSLPGRGRAESLRMLFKLAGQPFDDVRMTILEWRDFKAKGFYAESTIEQRELEAILRCVEVTHEALRPVIRDTVTRDFENRMRHWTQFKADTLGPVLDYLSRVLGANQFLVGDRLTWADVAVAEMLSRFRHLFDDDILSEHLELEALRRRVDELPEIEGSRSSLS